jgi:hypothetical protein
LFLFGGVAPEVRRKHAEFRPETLGVVFGRGRAKRLQERADFRVLPAQRLRGRGQARRLLERRKQLFLLEPEVVEHRLAQRGEAPGELFPVTGLQGSLCGRKQRVAMPMLRSERSAQTGHEPRAPNIRGPLSEAAAGRP